MSFARLYLFRLAIVLEVIDSAFLKLSEGFTNLMPSLGLIFFYALSFLMIIYALKSVSLSVGYSIWAGLGTAGAALVGMFFFQEKISFINGFGLTLIICGVVLMNWGKNSEEGTKLQRENEILRKSDL